VYPYRVQQLFYRYFAPVKNIFVHGTYSFTKKAWHTVHGYDDTFTLAQDYDFILRILKSSLRMKYLSDVLYTIDRHDEGLSITLATEQKRFFNEAQRKHSEQHV